MTCTKQLERGIDRVKIENVTDVPVQVIPSRISMLQNLPFWPTNRFLTQKKQSGYRLQLSWSSVPDTSMLQTAIFTAKLVFANFSNGSFGPL